MATILRRRAAGRCVRWLCKEARLANAGTQTEDTAVKPVRESLLLVPEATFVDAWDAYRRQKNLRVERIVYPPIEFPKHDIRKRVYLANLPFDCEAEEIQQFGATAGLVDHVELIGVNEAGQHAGKAVLVYRDPADAVRARRELDRTEFGGRTITVREDYVPKRTPRDMEIIALAEKREGEAAQKVLVTSLPSLLDSASWVEFAGKFGELRAARLYRTEEGRITGIGLAKYADETQAARAAQKMDRAALLDNRIWARHLSAMSVEFEDPTAHPPDQALPEEIGSSSEEIGSS